MSDSSTGVMEPDTSRASGAAERIDRDLPCIGCNYNLRTLAADATCPECGAAVERSIMVERLMDFEPWWLRRLARGAIYFWISIAASVGLGFLIPLLANLRSSGDYALLPVVTALSTAVVTLCVSVWHISTPNPDLKGWRWWVHIGWAARLLFPLGLVSVPLAEGIAGAIPNEFPWLRVLVVSVLPWSLPLALVLAMWHLQSVMRRIRKRRLRVGFLVADGLLLVGLAAMTFGIVAEFIETTLSRYGGYRVGHFILQGRTSMLRSGVEDVAEQVSEAFWDGRSVLGMAPLYASLACAAIGFLMLIPLFGFCGKAFREVANRNEANAKIKAA